MVTQHTFMKLHSAMYEARLPPSNRASSRKTHSTSRQLQDPPRGHGTLDVDMSLGRQIYVCTVLTALVFSIVVAHTYVFNVNFLVARHGRMVVAGGMGVK